MTTDNQIYLTQSPNFDSLVDKIVRLVSDTKTKIVAQINDALVITNWHIGEYIVEYEQQGNTRATYGDALIKNLSRQLSLKLGRGFSRSNLQNMRRFYLYYPICQTVSGKLSWSHWCELLELDDELERKFYENESIAQNWSVRTLKRQINAGLFLRLAKSRDKSGILELARDGQSISTPADAVKDTYVLEFLGLPESVSHSEATIEQALIDNLQQFLLELGKGFAFISQQYPIHVGNEHYHADLVFYHAILKCYVVIDLKRSGVRHQDIGQMNMYLGYFAKEVSQPDDNPPIGIVLGHTKNDLVVEYATYGMDSNIFVSKYQLFLPNRDELREVIRSIINS